MKAYSDEIVVRLKDCCFQIRYRRKWYPLSLAPKCFFPEEELCICSYPKCKFYELHTIRKIDRFDTLEEQIYYEKVIAPGIFYQKPYRRIGFDINELYNNCTSLNNIINFIKQRKPPINLLTALIYCLKTTSNNWIYDIISGAMMIAVKDSTSDDILSNSLITFVPRHKDDMKIDRFDKNIKFNQAELLAKSLASKLGLDIVDIIEKIMPTKKSPKNRERRYLRAKEVYKIRSNNLDLKDVNIILVDDVRTTGATSTYISKLLYEAGVSRIYITVAGRSVLDEDYGEFFKIEQEKCGKI